MGYDRAIMRAVLTASLIALALGACAAQAPDPAQSASDPALDPLFEQLADAPSAADASQAEQQVWQIWSQSGSATVDVLMERAIRTQAAGDHGLARQFMDEAVALLPGNANGWYQRAILRLQGEDVPGALSDIQETLKREPRHFAALASLGLIYEDMGQEKRALDAFREALAVHPQLETAKQGVARLSPKVEGRDT